MGKIDILYIVGKNSQWGNNELRYSLRSIAKHGYNVGKVVVAGYVPRFVNRDTVVCVDIKDKTPVKHWNILNAIIEACNRVELTDDFLLSSDDHFYFRDTDFGQYPIFRRGVLPPLMNIEDDTSKYHRTLVNTRQLLRKHGYSAWRFCWHGNTHLNRTLILSHKFYEIAQEANTMPEGCEPTCLVLNMLYKQHKFKITDREDKKLHSDVPEEQIYKILKDRECLSATNEIGGSHLHDILAREFPHKCLYEIQ